MVHTPARSTGHGSEVPAEYVVVYVAVALVVWFVVTLYAARHLARTEPRPLVPAGETAPKAPTGGQIGEAVFIGFMAAFLWPASAVAGGLWLAVRHMTRTA
jgi:predicted Co/Zn/Cd cation transporter (cation efflux family)